MIWITLPSSPGRSSDDEGTVFGRLALPNAGPANWSAHTACMGWVRLDALAVPAMANLMVPPASRRLDVDR